MRPSSPIVRSAMLGQVSLTEAHLAHGRCYITALGTVIAEAHFDRDQEATDLHAAISSKVRATSNTTTETTSGLRSLAMLSAFGSLQRLPWTNFWRAFWPISVVTTYPGERFRIYMSGCL